MAFTKWETPEEFFDRLNNEFDFTLDACADESNFKVEEYFDETKNGLEQEWSGNRVWLNPPYDRSIGEWMKKAYETAQLGGLVVALIQGRSTDTIWWHKYVMKASEIRIIKDRLHFGMNGKFSRANISSVIVIFKPYCTGYPNISSINNKGESL
ncbi:MAG: adenine methyltransferase [Alphaproteobacteria bacterium]|nr:adenine methyltransferase [Alphaproteobacteria bacterium]